MVGTTGFKSCQFRNQHKPLAALAIYMIAALTLLVAGLQEPKPAMNGAVKSCDLKQLRVAT